MSAYTAALAHTFRVLVIEGGPYGTTCARVGCMPSKLLIAAAEAAHAADQAYAFGIRAEAVHVDGAAVMKRVRDERDRFVGFTVDAVEGWPPEPRLRGYAKFLDDHTLQVDEHTQVVAERIVIATGSRTNVPAQWRQAAGERLIVNDDVFEWSTLPDSVAVLGAGVIALELSQALTSQIVGDEIPVQMQAKGLRLSRDGDDVLVHVGHDTQRFERVLVASGRSPNLEGLDLLRTTLPIDTDGIPVYDQETGRVGQSHVFMAGDVTNELTVLHEAADSGRIAGDNAGRYPEERRRKRLTPLSIVFSDPQISDIPSIIRSSTKACARACGISHEPSPIGNKREPFSPECGASRPRSASGALSTLGRAVKSRCSCAGAACGRSGIPWSLRFGQFHPV